MTPLIGLLVGAFLGPKGVPRAQNVARPRNVLFLFSDDQRCDTIAAYGNDHIRTPTLDGLVRRGFSFRRAYCMGSIHGAVCQPSRAMLMTGRTLYRVPMDMSGCAMLPELLRKRGFRTFGTGKWHNGKASFRRGFERGVAVMLGGMSNHERVPVQDLGANGKFGPRRVGAKFSSELFADAAVDFLRQQAVTTSGGVRPFFAYVAFTAPHDPRQPPKRLRAVYKKSPPPLPRNFMPQHPFNNGWLTGRDEQLAAWPRSRKVVQRQLGEYYGMITHLDEQIGRILATLHATGLDQSTLVVFASDHGLALGSHGLLGKQSLYEHSMRTPLILAGPGVPADGSSRALVYLYDVFPTLCDLLGVQVPPGVEGKSLAGILAGREGSVRATLFTTYENSQRAVRGPRWKLMRYPRIDKTVLFDLLNDPDELYDLAVAPMYRGRVASLVTLLKDWQRRVDDPHPFTAKRLTSAVIDLSGRARKPDRWQPRWIVDLYFR